MIRAKPAFSLIEVMMGLVIASFALSTLLSYLHHLTLVTQKSSIQGNSIIEYTSMYPELLLNVEKDKEKTTGQEKKISLEPLSQSSVLNEYANFLKKVTIDKQSIQLIFVPPAPKKEKTEENK